MLGSLKKAQRDKARQFMVFTGVGEKVAIEVLQGHNWNVEQAVDNFFSGGGAAYSSEPQADASKIAELFERYRESGSDSIEIEGIEKFCADLKVDPTDQIVLLIAWQMNAETMGVFTRDEWTGGMMAMGVEDIPQLIAAFPTLRQLLNSDGNFQDFYTFCFRFSKDPGHGVRTLPFEVASQMWQLTLASRFKFMEQWLAFLTERSVKAVTKDVWDMLLAFSTTIDDDMSNFDEDGAWPVLLDEFVEWFREKQSQL